MPGVQLNKAQREAAIRVDGQTLLLAVPGSGKTTTLLARLAYMTRELGIQPQSVLALAYNVVAARQLRERFGADTGVEFRTIHGLAWMTVSAYAEAKGSKPFTLIEREADVSAMLRGLYREQTGRFASENDLRELRTKLTYSRNMLYTDAQNAEIELDGADFAALARGYREKKRERALMDYDDMCAYALAALQTDAALLARFRERFQYISVDEAQDVSKLQHALIALLAGRDGNLFMVGDEDQSIYGFRAAYPRALLSFKESYPNGEIVYLEENFRSGGEIVAKADAFIRRNKQRHDKRMYTRNAPGVPPRRVELSDVSAQPGFIVKLAEGGEPTTVLYRNSESALPIIAALRAHGLGYACRERDSLFFTHPIVTDILNILRLAHSPEDIGAFGEVYYKLGCYLTKADLAVAEAEHKKHPNVGILSLLAAFHSGSRRRSLQTVCSLLGALPRLPGDRAIRVIDEAVGYGDYLQSRRMDRGKLDTLRLLAASAPTAEELPSQLDALREAVTGGGGGGSLTLSTIHACKGAEFDNVVIIDAYDGVLPSGGEDELEEERRLFYVAATRAKKTLCVLTARRRFGGSAPDYRFADEFFGVPEAPAPVKVAKGARLRHKAFGDGTVTAVEKGKVFIRFDSSGREKCFMEQDCADPRFFTK